MFKPKTFSIILKIL